MASVNSNTIKKERVSLEEEAQVPYYYISLESTQVPAYENFNQYGMLDTEDTMSDEEERDENTHKKRKLDYSVDSLPPLNVMPLSQVPMQQDPPVVKSYKQFWKAGDYEVPRTTFSSSSGGLNHARIHPKFLHSNATSHKWALGALAELLDNSVDEINNGATYVNMDMLRNKKDWSKMLLVQDNGGGMNMETIRHCMSFGYSAKSKVVNTIGRYGNGFKTSTMRLGADVIVFSRCLGKDGMNPTQSIGMLSYTFLRNTGKDDIVVPVLDYEKIEGQKSWNKIMQSSVQDWDTNLEAIVQWSPYSSEADLLDQFKFMDDHGTRVVIYNLWEDDQEKLELDFDTDSHDIQIRGINKDATVIEMANKFPSSKHFLTYRYSLRSYTSILYLKLPPNFKIVLRGEAVENHNIVNDMMLVKNTTYKPQSADGVTRNLNTAVDITMGFVKDAKDHIDVQGFNVYHKNRLILPFWRVWSVAGSGGRGVIGVLEANFVEPAHDKQGFENTPVLRKLQNRLMELQKLYWRQKCQEVGYAPSTRGRPGKSKDANNVASFSKENHVPEVQPGQIVRCLQSEEVHATRNETKIAPAFSVRMNVSDTHLKDESMRREEEKSKNCFSIDTSGSGLDHATLLANNKHLNDDLEKWKQHFLRYRESERKKFKSLEATLKEKEQQIQELQQENVILIDLFSAERNDKDKEAAYLRSKLEEMQKKLRELESMKSPVIKQETL